MMFYAGIDSAAEAAKEEARRGQNHRRACENGIEPPDKEATAMVDNFYFRIKFFTGGKHLCVTWF